jgi:hypothetical protein
MPTFPRLFFVLCLLAGFVRPASAQLLYDDFQTTRRVAYPSVDGTLTQNAANPATNAVNSSPTVGRYARNGGNPYATINIVPTTAPKLGDVTPYLNGTKLITMKMYSPAAGVPVQIVLQDKTKAATGYPNGNLGGTFNATTSVANAWEVITFTYAPGGGGTFDPSVPVTGADQVALLISFGVASGATYYFDDMMGPEFVASTCNAAFTYPGTNFCQSGSTIPTITGTPGGTFSSNGGAALNLNATTGAINLLGSSPGTYNITYTVSSTCSSVATITVNLQPTAGFSYSPSTYCTSSTGTATPTLAAGATAGTFTAPAGLTINATTGAITPSTSTPGTYTVTNTVTSGGCAPVTSTSSVTINTGASTSSAFSYPGTSFCQNGSIAATITGATGGTFTSNGGAALNLNGTTGAINLTGSSPGTYTVTYTVGGTCPSSSTASVSVRLQPTAQFSYTPTAFCTSGGPSAAPVLGTNAVAGTFSSTAGLTIDPATGVITPATSTPGSYTVTNTVAANGTCGAATATTSVTIVSGAGTSSAFSYPGTAFCQAGTTTATITGTPGGTFTANGGAGLALNGTTGAINLTGSTPGTYIVTYTVGGTCSSSSTATLTIRVQPNGQFSYSPSAYCASGTASPTPTLGAGAVAGTFTYTSSAAVTLDGQVLPAEGYSLLGTYTGPHGFGPHGLISLYAKSTATKVYIAMTGALEDNGNSFQLYLNQPNKTGVAAGTTLPLSNLTGTSFQLNAAKMDFEVDYGFAVKGGATVSNSSIIDYTRITGTGAAARATDQLSSDLPNAGTPVAAPTALTGGLNGTRMAFKNVKDLTLNTGVEAWEIELDKATLNILDGAALQLFAVQNNGDGGFYSTDFIPQSAGLTANPGLNPDFTTLAGSQFVGFTAGTGSGLTLNATTGAITPGTSTPGTYTITNSVAAAGGCGPSIGTTTVVINPLPSAAFSYPAAAFCQSGSTTATITGATGGTFTANGGAGLNLNGTTGAINLTGSTPGTYIVTYTVGGTCTNSATATITINQPANPLFSYPATSYCTSNTAVLTPTLAAGGTAGTFTSTTGLTLNATTGAITPSTSTPGTYTVTNTATTGGCAAAVGTTQVTINAAPATLTPSGATAICQGSSVVLTGPTGTALTYQFQLNGTDIPGATTGSYTATTAGNYTVRVTNAAGCTATSPAVAVTVNPVTTATFSYPAASFCQNGTTAATVTGTAGGTFTSTAGLSITAATGAINLTGSTPGTYVVTYAVAGPCPSSSTFSVTVTPQTTSQFTYPAAAYCTSAAAVTPTLTGTSVAGTFSSTAGLTINATTGAITPATSTPGTYTVTNAVTATGGCGPTASTATVTINATPARPTITAAYNGSTTTLTSSAATGNQFYLGGVLIPGATGQTYVVNGTPAQLGSYTVVVTGANGCTSQASVALVVTANRSAAAGTSLAIYPNPTPDGKLTVELRGYQQAVEITLLNALGQQVMARSLPAATVGAPQQLELQGLANGVYVLRATTAGGVDTHRIVVGR